MAKPNKRKLVEKLSEYRAIYDQIAALEADYQAEIAEAKACFEALVAGPRKRLEAERAELEPRFKKLHAEIEAELLLGVNEDGTIALPQVAAPGVIAEVAQQVTRTIDPAAWLEATAPEAREAKWYECISVLITKVDKHFGTQFERLIRTVSKPRVTIKFVELPAAAQTAAK